MRTLSCPNCGYGFEALRKSTRMFDCPSCGTTLFREADALSPVGNHGEMHETAMLIGIGDTVLEGSNKFDIIGHMRFDYGRGYWDEFWAENRSGTGVWISVDEGDVILQRALPDGEAPSAPPTASPGEQFGLDGGWFTVTEADAARLVAFRGQLPEAVELGETHRFVNASDENGRFVSGEVWDGGLAWFIGEWLDPFEMKIVRGDGA